MKKRTRFTGILLALLMLSTMIAPVWAEDFITEVNVSSVNYVLSEDKPVSFTAKVNAPALIAEEVWEGSDGSTISSSEGGTPKAGVTYSYVLYLATDGSATYPEDTSTIHVTYGGSERSDITVTRRSEYSLKITGLFGPINPGADGTFIPSQTPQETTPKKEKKPEATELTKLTAKSKGFYAKWKKVKKNSNGYEIQYSKDKKFKKNVGSCKVKGYDNTSRSIKVFRSGTFYVRVRTTGKAGNSAWCKAKKVKIK